MAEDVPLLKTDPKKVRGQHYDVVVNGVELGGGSIRIHQPDVQKTIFEDVLQFRRRRRSCGSVTCLKRSVTARRRTAASRSALTGLCAILCGTPSIRDVIAFPKTAKGAGFDDRFARAGDAKQLRELHLELKAAKKE